MKRERLWLLGLFLVTLPLVTPQVRGADEIEYFSYLRSLVFDQDVDFANEYQWFYDRDPVGLAGFKQTFLDRREPETGRHINFAPIGTGVLWSPFYLLAHAGVLAARTLGAAVPADGFSIPYAAAACYASALYGFAGLLLIHDALARHGGFAPRVATLTVAALLLATPVFYYVTVGAAFSHACSLFAVALLLWLTLRSGDSLRDWLLVGLAGGLAGLIREQDALFLAVPAGLIAFATWRTRAWLAGLLRLALLGGAAVLVFVPQLLAYHALNGRYGPSRLVARKMSYLSPHFFDVLVDPAHGLFLWTPILLVAVVGLVVLALRRREPLLTLLAASLLLQVWINGSVESWHMAGAFGARRFVDATPVFAWGLAAAVAWALPQARSITVGALVLCVWWNLSLMVQFGLRLMDRQQLEWPRVALNQITEVPPRLAKVAWLMLTDRERLRKESH